MKNLLRSSQAALIGVRQVLIASAAAVALLSGAGLIGPASSVATAMTQDQPEPAVTLKVGDPAPALKPGKWIKGEPVTSFDKGTIYVIDFWATWCGPCVQAMPHLSKVANDYKDKGVVVIAQNVWEQDDTKVDPFVTKMGDKMDVRVALDDKSADQEGVMSTTWMRAAGQNGIPTTMIVDKAGTLVWLGHPMTMDKVLADVVAGTFDSKAFAAAQVKKQANQKVMQEKSQAIGEALQAGEVDKALGLVDEIGALDPELGERLPLIKFSVLMQSKNDARAYGMADEIVAKVADANALNEAAWMILTAPGLANRDLAVADKFATKAVEIDARKSAGILDTLARAKFDQGKKDEAIAIQKEAIEKASASEKEELEANLKKYQG